MTELCLEGLRGTRRRMEGGDSQGPGKGGTASGWKRGMRVGYWEGVFGCVKGFRCDGIPRGAVAAPSLEGPKAGLAQHQVLEDVGWDEMILKVLPSPDHL